MSQAKDIIDEIAHRLPDRNHVYPALNRAIRMVAKRLKYHNSSKVKGELSVSITADTSSGTFPSDFWGLLGKPYISGKTYTLKPLPDMRTKLIYSSNSVPVYYEVLGNTLNLIPGSTSAITICGYYWQRPTKITAPTNTMPYNELFDDAIQESILHVYAGGTIDPDYITTMEKIIYKSVDEIIPGIEQTPPTRMTNSMSLDSLMWEV